jgi:hypothetical protein
MDGTDSKTYCKRFGVDHGVFTWQWRVLVVVLEAGVVWEVIALRKDALRVEFLELVSLALRIGAILFVIYVYLDESAKSEPEWRD